MTQPLRQAQGTALDTSADSRSAAAFARAREVIPGGVNSPVRAFLSVGGSPRFIARAKGAYLYDVDGRVVFGELTSFPAGGDSPFDPESFDEEFGRHWTVPRRYR